MGRNINFKKYLPKLRMIKINTGAQKVSSPSPEAA